ncbi:hypothetical protein [Paractinoplanes deccanensis]|nr:hypothetical protein [Actinoplanes deccanensis]
MDIWGLALLASERSGESDVKGDLADIVGYFLGLFTAAGLLVGYMRLIQERRTFGAPEYAYIMVLLSGCAVWLFLVFRE